MFHKIGSKLVAALFVAVSCIFICGCASEEDRVSKLAETYVRKLFSGDMEDIQSIATPESVNAAQSLAGFASTNPHNKSAVLSVLNTTVNEDKAIVKVLVKRPGEQNVVVTVPLVKVDGEWKVAWTKMNGGMD